MRILHIIASIHPRGGGTSTACREIASAQAARGHQVSIVAYGAPSDDYAQRSGVTYTELPYPARFEPIMARPLRSKLRELARAHDVCHIHGMWEGICLQGAHACIQAGKPYAHSPHGMLDEWALSIGRTKKKLALALGFGIIPKRAAAIIVSNAHERDCLAQSGYTAALELVPHGVNLAALDEGMATPPDAPRGSGAVICNTGGSPYILFLGRLHSVKGLDLLINAFAEIARDFPNHKLVLAGPDGGEAGPLSQLARHVGLGDRILQPGPLWGHDKAVALRDAACFALLSEHENFGLSLAEAMACRIASIASRQCHFDALVTANAGIQVEREVPAAAAALRQLLSDPAAAKAMGLRGRALVESRFVWTAAAATLCDIYERIRA